MKTKKITYQVLAKNVFVTQKTFQRTVKADSNAYNEFEREARSYFDGYNVEFNHAGKVLILS